VNFVFEYVKIESVKMYVCLVSIFWAEASHNFSMDSYFFWKLAVHFNFLGRELIVGGLRFVF